MIKYLALLAVLAIGVRWVTGRWPWAYITPATPRHDALKEARLLLGVPVVASAADIREAHRRKAALAHPDRGGRTEDLQELNAARDLLLAHAPPTKPESPR
ncbi:J domain-containing protein [Qipengyuania sp.]|uniref:J domain-containing protein n=1 Tax=Qipengyuania sp. TaxID=2004515 RepID=UPI0037354F18